MLLVILLVSLSTHCVQAQFEEYKQSSGYVDVRKGAHMFYWLFYTTAPVQNYTERPLIIWLHGGPGNSAAGYAKFINVGPITNYHPEWNETPIHNFNVMYLDSPVGTGFSYIDDKKYLTKTNSEVANDFMVFIREFYRTNPEFEGVPLYLYGETYGSKMAVDMAIKLNKAEKAGTIKSNLRGIFMENPWVSPLDHIRSWPRMLKTTALVDQDDYEKVVHATKEIERLYNNCQYVESNKQRNTTLDVIVKATSAIDMYNIVNEAITAMPNTESFTVTGYTEIPDTSTNETDPRKNFTNFMNTVVKKSLNIPEKVVWVLFSDNVYNAHVGEFMKPIVDGIEKLLDTTKIVISIINSRSGLICSTPGQVAWISKMKWSGAQEFKKAPREPLWSNNLLEGYCKKQGNFRFYEINGINHFVALFTPESVHAVLRDVTTFG